MYRSVNIRDVALALLGLGVAITILVGVLVFGVVRVLVVRVFGIALAILGSTVTLLCSLAAFGNSSPRLSVPLDRVAACLGSFVRGLRKTLVVFILDRGGRRGRDYINLGFGQRVRA